MVIKASELIVILEYEGFCNCALNEELNIMPDNSGMHSDKEDIKSVVITTEQLYFSPLSSTTLQKRLNHTHQNKYNHVYE